MPNLPLSEVPPPNTPIPRLIISLFNDSTSAPGDTLTLRGAGWLANQPLVAEIFDANAAGDIGAPMPTDSFVTSEYGAFDIQAVIPDLLHSLTNGARFYVVPGSYVISIRSASEGESGNSVSASLTVGAPRLGGSLIWGDVGLDLSRNARSGNPDVAGAAALGLDVGLTATGPTPDGQPIDIVTDALGRYLLLVPAGIYTITADTSFGGIHWAHSIDVAAGELEAQYAPLVLEPSTV